MLDLDISFLRLNIDNASGHEHRIQSIAVRATEILTTRLEEKYKDKDVPKTSLTQSDVSAPTVNVDLNRTGNEQAARWVADAWLEAITLRLEV